MRRVILHYHFFKNAGSSIDAILRRSFGDAWLQGEFKGGANSVAVGEWIQRNPEKKAFSSHTANLPVPKLDGVEIFPILFVRHPFDRIRSAFEFERKQTNGAGTSAAHAKSSDLRGYVLNHPHRQCRDFHASRLAFNYPQEPGGEEEKALRTLDSLPFVGLVEEFDHSVRRLSSWLQPYFPELNVFDAHSNVSAGRAFDLEERLAQFEKAFSEMEMERVRSNNKSDLRIHEVVSAEYERYKARPAAIERPAALRPSASVSNITMQKLDVTPEARAALKSHRPAVIWFTGLPGAGKSTIANRVDRDLHAQGIHTVVLDGDNLRHGLNADLGFSDVDRSENIRRIAEVAKLFADAGLVVIVASISPFRAERQAARNVIGNDRFVEVFVDTPASECEARDPKGLWARAKEGLLRNFTGLDGKYEPPIDPELHLETLQSGPGELAETVTDYVSWRCQGGARERDRQVA